MQLHVAMRRITLLEDWVERIVPILDGFEEQLAAEESPPPKNLFWFFSAGLLFSLGALVGWKLFLLF